MIDPRPPLDFCNGMRDLADRLSVALRPKQKSHHSVEELWGEIRALHEAIVGPVFRTEIAPVFDAHVASMTRRVGCRPGDIRGRVELVGNTPFLFTVDALNTAQTYPGMRLDDFEITVNVGVVYLLSEIATFVIAAALGKAPADDLRAGVQAVRDAHRRNSNTESSATLTTGANDGEVRRYRTINTAEIAKPHRLHDARNWDERELDALALLRHAMIAFLLGHEFAHVTIETGRAYGHEPTDSEAHAASFMASNEIPPWKALWAEEFACDAIGLQLAADYVRANESNPRIRRALASLVPDDLARAGMIRALGSVVLPWIAAQTFLRGMAAILGHGGCQTHPGFEDRVAFLKYHLAMSSVPAEAVAAGQKVARALDRITG